MTRFDAYSATTSASYVDLISMMRSHLPGLCDEKQGRGFHQFGERLAFRTDDGAEVGSVMWGGKHDGLAMIEVKGEHTPAVVDALRSDFEHRCTRVDSCADFDAPRAFERLYRGCKQVKQAHKIIGGKAGDWEDFPEKGRTLYLGAKSSVARVRLYEKGKQTEYLHLERPNWARLEIQVRPAKDAKSEFARLQPLEVWGASRWTRELAGMLLQSHVDPHPAGSTYRKTEQQQRLEWLCRQYGPTLLELVEDCGSWETAGRTLQEIMNAQQRKSRRV